MQMVRGNTCECELLIIVAKLLWLRCSRHCYEKSLEENSSNRAVETRHAARQAAGNCQYLSVEVPERLVPSWRLLRKSGDRKLWTWRSADNPSDERFAPRNARITLSKSVEFSLQAAFGKAAVSICSIGASCGGAVATRPCLSLVSKLFLSLWCWFVRSSLGF